MWKPHIFSITHFWRWSTVALALALAVFGRCTSSSHAAPPEVQDAVTWYDTLGNPDAKDLPYVHVATGLYSISGNQPPQNSYVDGFLLHEEADAFTVFLCSVCGFQTRFEYEPYPPLTTVRFVRKTNVPAHKRVDYEVLDFKNSSSEVLARVSAQASRPYPGLQGGQPLSHRARIFAFARACQQKGQPEIASVLFDFAANIPDEQTGKIDPSKLLPALQRQIGEAVLEKAEKDCCNPKTSWPELLKTYENFDTRFPASPRLAYAREAAELLGKMIAEEAAHHPKPLEQMSPEEQVGENIYQLRYLGYCLWGLNQRYPLDDRTPDGKDLIAPVKRLIDLGNMAVPQLIEALDDQRFTHSMVPSFNGAIPIRVMRVADVARDILAHISGRNFWPETRERTAQEAKNERMAAQALAEAGLPAPEWHPIIVHTTREKAEAWWQEVQGIGEKQALIKTVSAGDQQGAMAAHQLIEKYPDAALDAIQAGIRATPRDGLRSHFVEAAALLPGEMPVAFLRSQLTPDHGVFSQAHAAKALLARGLPEGVPAMLETWRKIQPRLPTNESDAYGEVGGIISFLGRSGDARAVDALWQEGKKTPVEVRLAIVQMFITEGMNGGGVGPSVNDWLYMHDELRAGNDDAIQRLLVSALDDTERRFGLDCNYQRASLKDPRICDLAALALSGRWPEKYPFPWTSNTALRDVQIARLRDHWRAENRLPVRPTAPPPAIVIPTVKGSDVSPLLDEFATADAARRNALAAQIADTFGLGALPVVRARLEKSGDAAFRSLAINLASRVREVDIVSDAGDAARKSQLTSLKGQILDGARLDRLANALQSTLPEEARTVTLVAERAGDGTGFKITIEWLAGGLDRQTGWVRDMNVRCGEKSLYADIGGYTREGAMLRQSIYHRLKEAFEEAIQSEIDAPILMRLRIQRSRVE